MKIRPVLLAVLLAALVAVAAVAVLGTVLALRPVDGRPGPAMMADAGAADEGLTGATGGMPSMSGHLTEPRYLAEMVAHHEDAIVAARELARSGRPQVRALGAAIVESQSAQVDQMRAWLGEWYPDQAADTGYRPMMSDLSHLSGDALDRTFLREMVRHHMAAVMMSQHLLAQGVEHPEVARLARSIRDDQRAEIVTMRRWLARWFGDGAAGMGMMDWSS